jgi:uncharacterized protein (TIGR04141 family)
LAKTKKTKSLPRARKARTRNLTLLLLRDEFKEPEDALKTTSGLVEHPLDALPRMRGRLYLTSTQPHAPRWLDFLKEGFTKLPEFESSMPLGLLFIHASSRLFVLTLGQGRHLLKPGAFELDFGLKVTLNTADASKLRSLDLRTFEELTVHTRRQVSRGSPLATFNVDVSRDMLRAFTGEPKDPTLAKRFTGKEALVLTGPIHFSELADRCSRLLTEFQGDTYKKEFAWVDNIQAIRDAKVLADLDGKMRAMLKARSFDKAHLAPPDMLDWNEVPGFLYPGERGDLHPDLDLTECLDAIAAFEKRDPSKLELTVDDLKKRHKIRAIHDEASREAERWSLYDCLVLELDGKDVLYVLTGGQWFRIETGFVSEVGTRAATLARSMPNLPPARAHQVEGDYNSGVHASSKSFALLDEELIHCTGARSSIEPCDLLAEDGDRLQFIHVKRKTRSSTLSHLFSQGVISAQAFLSDAGFRKELKRRVSPQHRPNLTRRLGDTSKKPAQDSCEVIFAVITGTSRSGAKWPLSLPFFSQLNLTNAAERLEMLGYRVGICRIDEQK